MAQMRTRWTLALIEEAIRLKEDRSARRTWRQVAARLGVDAESLYVTVRRYKRGDRVGRVEQTQARLEVAVSMIQQGEPVHRIARELQMKRMTCHRFLEGHGYDAEVRRLYRQSEAA